MMTARGSLQSVKLEVWFRKNDTEITSRVGKDLVQLSVLVSKDFAEDLLLLLKFTGGNLFVDSWCWFSLSDLDFINNLSTFQAEKIKYFQETEKIVFLSERISRSPVEHRHSFTQHKVLECCMFIISLQNTLESGIRCHLC